MSALRRLMPVFLLALAGCTRSVPLEPLPLGYLAPGTESCARGIQLAVKEANEADGLPGGRRLTVLSPSFQPTEETVSAVATRLVTVSRVPALIAGNESTRIDAVGRAAQPGGATVVFAGSAPLARLGDNVLPARLAPEDQGNLLARFADEVRADRAALVVRARPEKAEGETVPERFAAGFARHWEKQGSARNADRFSLSGETDWPALAREIVAKEPKVIVLAGTPSDLAAARAALKPAGAAVPLLFGTDPAGPLDTEALAGAHVATLNDLPGDRAAREFAANYRKEFHEAPDEAARLGYDAARVVLGALRRARPLSRDRLREEFARGFVVCLEEGKAGEARGYKLPGR